MSNLVQLVLSYNELSGSLPTDMCTNLPFLAVINLSKNQLSGPIPTNFSQCSRLEVLALSYNSLSGLIPVEIGYLTSLQYLALGANNLSGMIPKEIGNLQRLSTFAVENNQIEGSIDFNIFINMSSLQNIYLWRNKFTGSLSKDVGNLTMAAFLDFSENFLTGVIPIEFVQLNKLEQLVLYYNTLSGSIPHELFNMSALKHIDVSLNGLTGTLPTTLCQDSFILEAIYIGVNSISGPIPNSISNCSRLKYLAFPQNNLTGYIPTDFCNLRLLQRLSLDTNNLMNAPSTFSSELSFITSLTNCRFLYGLSIGDNPLNGIIPASIGNFSSSEFKLFFAGNCELSGRIPDEIGNLRSLLDLELYGNKLFGNIPLTIKHMLGLQGFSLNDNMLEGSIPEAICDLYNLNAIHISRNQFSGSIPECLGHMPSLRIIYLDSNMFNSSIPSSLWGLKDLTDLDLSSNSLSGYIPEEISSMGLATYINLSMNQLSGSIPNTIGKLQSLVNLSLANNRLEGSIPDSVGSMINLVTLDLSYNNLSGSIPKSLEALQYLHNFNISFNSLSGEIPNVGAFTNFTMESFKGNKALCGDPRFSVPRCRVTSNHRSKRKKVEIALLILAGALAFVTILCLAFIFMRYKRKQKATDGILPGVVERISYYDLARATQQFSESNLLGTGSFGSVYRGVLGDGKVVAVKVFKLQSENAFKSFDVECEVLRNIRHRNLAKVLSSCSNEEFKALVVEYMPKGNLEQWLYSHNYFLDFIQRLDVMIDVASALEYLHHGNPTPIVHCDVKPSNVLLDEDMVAHMSDFGISKLLGDDESFVITNTLATLGYIAPEYGFEGLVSTRCDVYSYGVMLMETFSRKRPSDDMFGGDLSLKIWIENSVPQSTDDVMDPNLLMNLDEERGDKVVAYTTCILELSLKCSTESPSERINMIETLAELQKIKRQFLG